MATNMQYCNFMGLFETYATECGRWDYKLNGEDVPRVCKALCCEEKVFTTVESLRDGTLHDLCEIVRNMLALSAYYYRGYVVGREANPGKAQMMLVKNWRAMCREFLADAQQDEIALLKAEILALRGGSV